MLDQHRHDHGVLEIVLASEAVGHIRFFWWFGLRLDDDFGRVQATQLGHLYDNGLNVHESRLRCQVQELRQALQTLTRIQHYRRVRPDLHDQIAQDLLVVPGALHRLLFLIAQGGEVRVEDHPAGQYFADRQEELRAAVTLLTDASGEVLSFSLGLSSALLAPRGGKPHLRRPNLPGLHQVLLRDSVERHVFGGIRCASDLTYGAGAVTVGRNHPLPGTLHQGILYLDSYAIRIEPSDGDGALPVLKHLGTRPSHIIDLRSSCCRV